MEDPDDLAPAHPGPLSSRLAYVPFSPLSSTVTVQVAGCSHRGGRTANDDHYLIVELGRYQQVIATNLPAGHVPPRFDEAGYGMVVADGLGGAGATASQLAIATLSRLVLQF